MWPSSASAAPPAATMRTDFEFEQWLAAALERERMHILSAAVDLGDSGSLDATAGDQDPPDPSPSSDSSAVEPQEPCVQHLGHSEPEPSADRRKRKAKEAKRARRNTKRKVEAMERDPTEYHHSPAQLNRYSTAKRVRLGAFSAQRLPSTSNGFTGANQPVSQAIKTLEELLQEGYRLIPWDGIKPLLIEDVHGRIFVILAGRPVGDPSWNSDVVLPVEEALASAEKECKITTCKDCTGHSWEERCRKCCNRRGDYKSISVGVSFGGGQLEPCNLSQSPREHRITSALITNKGLQRLIGFINGAFAFFSPKLWRVYAENTEKVFGHHPNLERLFPKSVFPAATFNLGPKVMTLEHTDSTNLPYGLCAIYASGQFDPKRGGHLILQDLKVLIEFPPGSVVFLPSGTLMHGNAAVGAHETRRSFTQYAVGGLFRWVYYGFRPERVLKAMDPDRFAHSISSAPGRIQGALGLFSTASSLPKDRAALAM